mmetsp:Transcript_22529/g.41931  ORF Transcript_22529/g.41931 Transcript_22529/m.41931 type:complete len:1001 (-) Transcript_22529:354-3356(-)
MKVSNQQPEMALVSKSTTMFLRRRDLSSSSNGLPSQPVGSHKKPLNTNKDAADRPYFDVDAYFKAASNNDMFAPDNFIESFNNNEDNPLPSISYFPDQVTQVSFLVSVFDDTQSGEYLVDLKRAVDVLATELAPQYFPGVWVRQVMTSIDGWSPTACPKGSNLKNCMDITSSVGLYLNVVPVEKGKEEKNTIELVNPSSLTKELRAFDLALEEAIANNRLQQIIESFYDTSEAEPHVYVIPVPKEKEEEDYYEDEDEDNTNGVSNNNGNNNDEDDDTGSGGNQNNNHDTGEDEPTGTGSGIGTVEPTETDSGIGTVEPTGTGSEISTIVPTESNSEFSTNAPTGAGTVGGTLEIPTGSGRDPFPETTTTTGGALPAFEGYDPISGGDEDLFGIGGIIGIVLGILAAVFVVLSLVQFRRTTSSDSSRETILAGVGGKANKKIVAKSQVDDDNEKCMNDSKSDDSDSSDHFLQPLDADEYALLTSHSRGTAATVSASASMSAASVVSGTSTTNSSHNSSAGSPGGRGREQWKKDEIVIPLKTKRALKTWNEVDEDKRLDSEEDEGSETLKPANQVYPPTDDFDSESAGSYPDPSILESSRLSMVSRSFASFRKGRKSSTSNLQRSKQELEQALSAVAKESDGDHGIEGRDPDYHSLSDSQGVYTQSTEGSYGEFAQIRPLSLLDEAIMNGDWASVGATAALMAASLSPEDKGKRRHSTLYEEQLWSAAPPEKAEFDRLIEAGDWEAVVLAAARHDAAESGMESNEESARSRTSTQDSDTVDESYASTMDHSSANCTTKGSVTTSGSQKESIQEIRSRVEELVRDVVPDELENIDEMMAQFKGKEEELLETLRTMKERDVAKKARLESQKIARRNTRAREKKEDLVPPITQETPVASSGPVVACLCGDSEDLSVRSSSGTEPSGSITTTSEEGAKEDIYSERLEMQGSFEQATQVDHESTTAEAAAAAAEWAIAKSLSEMMEKEKDGATDTTPGAYHSTGEFA